MQKNTSYLPRMNACAYLTILPYTLSLVVMVVFIIHQMSILSPTLLQLVMTLNVGYFGQQGTLALVSTFGG